jgi:hypothetical protein
MWSDYVSVFWRKFGLSVEQLGEQGFFRKVVPSFPLELILELKELGC